MVSFNHSLKYMYHRQYLKSLLWIQLSVEAGYIGGQGKTDIVFALNESRD